MIFILLLINSTNYKMETSDLLLFEEESESLNPFDEFINNEKSTHLISIENELIETKNKVKALEDRIKFLEEKFNRISGSTSSFTMIPMKNSIRNNDFYFCDVNCSEIKIDSKHYIYMDDCLFDNIIQFKLFDHDKNINPSVKFLQQFKNIKTLLIDLAGSCIGGGVCYNLSESRDIEQIVNVLQVIIESNKDFEIIFKSPDLYNHRNYDSIFMGFMKTTSYKKLTIEIKDNLIINKQTGGATYATHASIHKIKKHCVENKIDFKTNIGV